MIKKIYIDLKTPEKDAKKIGVLRTLCAIFGGLLVAFLAMTTLAFITPGTLGDSVVVPLLFNTLAYAAAAFWIIVSPSRLSALLRTFVPSFAFAVLIFVFSKVL